MKEEEQQPQPYLLPNSLPPEGLEGNLNVVENLFRSIRHLYTCNDFKHYPGKKDSISSEHFFIGKHENFGIRKSSVRIVISELPPLPPEFIEELKSGEKVTSSILGV